MIAQDASAKDHEVIKCGAQALKKLCRLKTNLSWKEWRLTMESQKGTSLQVPPAPSLHITSHTHMQLRRYVKFWVLSLPRSWTTQRRCLGSNISHANVCISCLKFSTIRSSAKSFLASKGFDFTLPVFHLQSKLHLLQHDRGFLQSNVKYLTELGNKVAQYAQESRAGAAAAADAHTREAVSFSS